MEAPTILRNMQQIVTNQLLSRAAWLQRMLDPRRNIASECGHPQVIINQDYVDMYERNDIAARVVGLYPDACWQKAPDIFETDEPTDTPWEKAWKELSESLGIFTHLHHADVISGIGRYGVLILGFDDGVTLDKPINFIPPTTGIPTRKLLYLRALDESLIKISQLEGDQSKPRFGLPTMYQCSFEETSVLGTTDTTITDGEPPRALRDVHWTRIIHFADNRTHSLIYGVPRLKRVFNRVLDLQKIAGGSAEMFWKGGFPGLSVETMPSNEQVEFDVEATKEQMIAYMNGLQRYIATQGMSVKSLTVQIADPSKHIETQIRLISIALSCPWRIFMGAEVGQLASEQDIREWNSRIERRRERYLNPNVIYALIDRLIQVGVLPTLGNGLNRPTIEWNDLNTPSNLDKATVAEKKTKAMLNFVQGKLDSMMPLQEYLTTIMGLREEEAAAIVAKATFKSQFKVDPPTNAVPGSRGTAQTSATRPAPGSS